MKYTRKSQKLFSDVTIIQEQLATGTDLPAIARGDYRSRPMSLIPPSANTTGYRGRPLTDVTGTFTTTDDFQLIVGQHIVGNVFVNHTNVVFMECWIEGVVQTFGATANLLMIDCEIGNSTGIASEAGVRDGGFTLVRCYVHGFGDACKGGLGKTYIYECLLKDQYRYNPGSGYVHCDCIQHSGAAAGAYDFDVIGNYMDNRTFGPGGDSGTSCIMFKSDFGPQGRARIERNWFSGTSAYGLYVIAGSNGSNNYSAPSPVVVKDNLFARTFVTAPYSLDDKSIVFGNRWLESDGSAGPLIEPTTGSVNNCVRLDGTSTGSKITTPWVSGRTPSGSMFFEADVAPDSWVTGSTQSIAAAYDSAAGTQSSWRFNIGTTGVLSFRWYYNSSNGNIQVTTTRVRDWPARMRRRLGVWYEQVSSTVYKVHFYDGPGGQALTAANEIEVIQATVTSGQTSVYDANVPITIGCRLASGAQSDRLAGDVSYFSQRATGIGGTLLTEFNPAVVTVQATNSPSTVTATTGEVYTLTSTTLWKPQAPTVSPRLALLKQRTGTERIVLAHLLDNIDRVERTLTRTPVSVSADYKMWPTDGTVRVTTGASTITVTLPALAYSGMGYKVEKVDAGAGTVVVKDVAGNTITPSALSSQWQSVVCESDGSTWIT